MKHDYDGLGIAGEIWDEISNEIVAMLEKAGEKIELDGALLQIKILEDELKTAQARIDACT